MRDRVNIFDIAEEAGVSIATVSRVLSGRTAVRPETRARVMRVVEKYGFRPNMVATGLSKRNTHTLGVVLPLIDNPFYTKLCIAAQQEAERLGYALLMHQVVKGAALDGAFTDALIGRRLDGVLLSGDVAAAKDDASVLACVAQLRPHMPVVVVNPPQGDMGCPCLYSDLAGCARMAVRHLHSLGHVRIAMLGGHPAAAPHSREAGFAEEAARLRLPAYPATHGDTPADGAQCARQLLAQVPPAERPTALVAFNDLVALGALRHLKELGLRVPQDVAMVGCDNQFFAPYTDPPLTTVDLCIEDTGKQAVRLLLEAQGEESAPRAQVFTPRLVVRGSCGERGTGDGGTPTF